MINTENQESKDKAKVLEACENRTEVGEASRTSSTAEPETKNGCSVKSGRLYAYLLLAFLSYLALFNLIVRGRTSPCLFEGCSRLVVL